ncbi:GNAT family N-acetyltransferase [Solihabitans fulvus]|uniref:GNAT family N-acetyltransferase n=1 Tax=Solihabitans fulvus TaxID=1892852 RepID=A0A5B2X6S5_9PSEU|nr:GNAT family N-acetyltransferase [Solihabitans fulvus]KAA2258612.1 GNAT family N-acetyltransferase [Solihabitans fulvus]
MAEAAVRPATLHDAPEIARIQVDTWRTAYNELLPEAVLAGLDVDGVAGSWRQAVEEDGVTLLVATEGSWVVGFCAAGPAPRDEVAAADGGLPADAETTVLVGTLLVEPRWGRRGHGGRLLATAAHALHKRGATRGIAWVPEADAASLAFYLSVGWTADGTVRTLDADGRPLREIRLTGGLALPFRD